MTDVPAQPNKPGGNVDCDGEPRGPDDLQAVKNQSVVMPDDYPPGSDGKPPVPDRKD